MGATGVFVELRAALPAMLGGGFQLSVALVAQTAAPLALRRVTERFPVLAVEVGEPHNA